MKRLQNDEEHRAHPKTPKMYESRYRKNAEDSPHMARTHHPASPARRSRRLPCARRSCRPTRSSSCASGTAAASSGGPARPGGAAKKHARRAARGRPGFAITGKTASTGAAARAGAAPPEEQIQARVRAAMVARSTMAVGMGEKDRLRLPLPLPGWALRCPIQD